MIREQKIVKCDICGKEEFIGGMSLSKDIKSLKMPVLFLTEQQEGRSIEPYIDTVNIEICPDCFKKGVLIRAVGAMGYNNYHLEEPK